MKIAFKRYWSLVKALFPSKLPGTPAAHYKWATRILETAGGLPDNDSFRHALATMIMHLGPTVGYKSDYYFIVSLRKSIANQVAYNQIKDINERKKTSKEVSEVVEGQIVS